MTKMIAGVAGPDEADAAIAGGADLVHIEDPAAGALGAASASVLAAVIGRVAGRRPVWAAAGRLPMDPAAVLAAVGERLAADVVTVGIFPAPAAARLAVIEALHAAGKAGLFAVFFADGDPDPVLLPRLKAAGFAGAMLGMLEPGRGLLGQSSATEFGGFAAACRQAGLLGGFAGSLEAPDVPRLLVHRPDYLGLRGALTRGGRSAPVDRDAVAEIRALIDAEGAGSASPNAAESETDRIFVRDFTLEMEVGAYSFERGRKQKVRFTVEADIPRLRRRGAGMAGVYSYDLIMDAIRALAARGHTDLVETLAESLAETVLGDPRVAAVTVRVEKLELGPAAAGVEIRRGRPR